MEQSLLCVHAHPDDEVLFTGGLLARASEQGQRTMLVTCTDGRWGYSPGYIEMGHDDHDPDATARQRSVDLRKSAEILGVSEVIELRHFDSGMRGWEVNALPEAFVQQPTELVAAGIAQLIDERRPELVVTYDRFGVYGHPDHVKAHEVTVAALKMATVKPKFLVVTVLPKTAAKMMTSLIDDAGSLPQWLIDMGEFGTSQDQIVETVDARRWLGIKRAAIMAHESQVDNHFFLGLDDERFAALLGVERYAAGEV
jgi:LmbE family N-acetylglucosaminyl deacetylase